MSQQEKSVKQFKPNNWYCLLEVGPNFVIQIAGYVKISESRAGKFKRFENHARESFQVKIDDPEFKEVIKEEIIQAFKFGTNIIPFDGDLQNEVKYNSGDKSFKIMEFRKMHTVPSHLWAGRGGALVIYPREDHLPHSYIALSTLYRVMKSLNVGALVRRVWNSRSRVKIGWLIPKPDEEGVLLYFQLPFAQQLRAITKKRKKPSRKGTENQKKAMGSFIDALTNDHDFDPYDILDPSEVYLQECCEAKELDTENPISPPSEEVLAIFNQTHIKEKERENMIAEFFELWPKLKNNAKEKKSPKTEIVENSKNENSIVKIEKEENISSASETLFLELKDFQERLQNQYGSISMERLIEKLNEIRKGAIKSGDLCKVYNDWWISEFHEFVNQVGLDYFWEAVVSYGYGPISTLECSESNISPSKLSQFTCLEELKWTPKEAIEPLHKSAI